MADRNIVLKIDAETDRREVYATTYQLRNPFHQFGDCVTSELDAFNYFSLAYAADLCPRGARVLDLCCGRGLLIPFLRYRMAQPQLYVGVDLEPKNATWRTGQDPRRRGAVIKEGGWGFDLIYVEASVGDMIQPIKAATGEESPQFEFITYMSAIEHMQPSVQQASLTLAGRMANTKTVLYLTCPVTEEDKDGYDCQYAAHIYEPKTSELAAWLENAGWKIDKEIGLLTKVSVVKQRLTGEKLERARELIETMPREQSLTTIAHLYPETATEKAYICSLKGGFGGGRKKIRQPPPDGGLLGMIA